MLRDIPLNERTVITRMLRREGRRNEGEREIVFEGSLSAAADWAKAQVGQDLSAMLAAFPDRGRRPFTAPVTSLLWLITSSPGATEERGQ